MRFIIGVGFTIASLPCLAAYGHHWPDPIEVDMVVNQVRNREGERPELCLRATRQQIARLSAEFTRSGFPDGRTVAMPQAVAREAERRLARGCGFMQPGRSA